MRWTDTVSMAWRAIVAQRGRSVLTLLGIAVLLANLLADVLYATADRRIKL